jgi:hypothetical protein
MLQTKSSNILFSRNQIRQILSLDKSPPVYFTKDESQMVTHFRLVQEIKNIILLETRSSLLDLSSQLNIDFSNIDDVVREMVIVLF